MKNEHEVLNQKFLSIPFRAKMANIVRGKDWTAGKLNEKYAAGFAGINDSPKYQRPDCVGFPPHGDGDEWQRKLVRDFIMGHPIQPLHFRAPEDTSRFIFEIVDGGHRTRTIVNFIRGNVRTPANTVIESELGDVIDISNMLFSEIAKKYPFLSEYVLALPLDVYEYYNLSDDDAEELFLKLNDLHDMTPADKRNAINNIIADTCRKFGAVDSPDAFPMFRETESPKKGSIQLRYTSLDMSGRETDEVVSWALYYLYKKGIRSKISMGTQSVLNVMYRDTNLITRLSDEKDSLYKQLVSCLTIMNDIVCNHQLKLGVKGNKWGVHALKKLIMCVAEAHYVPKHDDFMFKTIKIDTTKFFKELNAAITSLRSDTKVKHHPYQIYEIVNKVVTPLSRSKQSDKVNYGQSYSFLDVFKGGHRYDDFMFCYHHLVVKGLLEFGKKGSTPDTKRFFSDKDTEELLVEQNYRCKRCNLELNNRNEYQVDHIVPHDVGGITDVRNGQILCNDCNGRKSNGMHISDVLYVCEKMGYTKTDSLVEVIGEEVLSAESIKLVAKKLFG
jgi:hypothetical protein